MQEHITGFTVAAQIQMEMSDHLGPFVVVEGRDDVLFFSKFCDTTTVRVIVGVRKQNVMDAITILEGRAVSVALGVVDRDFDRPFRGISKLTSLVMYDENDLEMMMIMSKAFERLIGEKQNDVAAARLGERGFSSARDFLLEYAAIIGSLRFVSASRHLGLRFRLDNWRFLNQRSFDIDRRAFVESVLSSTRFPVDREAPGVESLMALMSEVIGRFPRRAEICRGHDVMQLFGFALKSFLGSLGGERCSVAELESDLRLAFAWEDLEVTEFLVQLRRWEAVRGMQLLRVRGN